MRLSPLPVSFYNRPALEVARELLGARLVRVLEDGACISGMINETEAYQGEADLACHARAGRTPRTEVMYGQPGRAYIYFVYGMHWMLNCVAEEEGCAAAVLIRSIVPEAGFEAIAQRRGKARRADWTNGPARLCQALGIDGTFNCAVLHEPQSGLWIAQGEPVPEEAVMRGPRVGIPNVPEPWRSIPWRFLIAPSSSSHSPARS